MSGHNKWSTIKRKKGANDAARAKIFTKIGRELAVAVKNGGPDPNNNAKLRDVIAKAKQNNVPNDNIERMLKKAAGDYNFISYARFNKEEQCLIVVNNGYNDVTKDILVWEFGIPRDCKMERLILTSNSGFTGEKETYNVVAGKLTLTLPPTSVMVLKHYKE